MLKQKFVSQVSGVVGVLSLIIPMLILPKPAAAQLSLVRSIMFPVVGHASFSDDFADPRSGGRTHEGNDIFGKKMQPLVAVVDGTISFVAYPQASWGYSISIRDKDGYKYNYLHVNNDNPGTDDGKGDGMFAYAPDVASGNTVVRGQLVGYMGDSGNAETTAPHLHFEIRTPDGQAFSPYESLSRAERVSAPVSAYPAQADEILPYADFKGGMSVAVGNFDTDNNMELVTGAGPGGGPLTRVFEQDGTAGASFYAYGQTFRGGIDVATGDIDNDGKAEIITAPGAGGGPHIRIFKSDGTVVKEFFAYDQRFHGGVNIAAVDIDNDGKAEIITAPGAGGGPHIKVFTATGVLVKEFFAYDSSFKGGVDVAATKIGGGISGNSSVAIVTAPGAGGGPHIKVFDGTGTLTKEFFAYDGKFDLGVRVSAGNADNDQTSEIAVLPATGGGPHLKVFGLDGVESQSGFAAFEPWWRSGYDLAIGGGEIFISAGAGRRASLRTESFGERNNRFNGRDNDDH